MNADSYYRGFVESGQWKHYRIFVQDYSSIYIKIAIPGLPNRTIDTSGEAKLYIKMYAMPTNVPGGYNFIITNDIDISLVCIYR